jgi:hypothetical protein
MSRDEEVVLFHCIRNPQNLKCEERPKVVSAFRLPGFKRQESHSSTASGNPETRNAKCKSFPGSHFGISATGIQRMKGCSLPLHQESPKPEARKEKCLGAISFQLPGCQETRELLLHCIGNHRNPKREECL